METPSWTQVDIPSILVNFIKELKPGFTLDTLVNQLVLHSNKRLFVSYICENCDYVHTPNRTTEEVTGCPSCYSARVRCVQSLKFSKQSRSLAFSRNNSCTSLVIEKMLENYTLYFKSVDFKNFEWSWNDDKFQVKFAGGEPYEHEQPKVAVAKAALLCPYLWDMGFDWKSMTRKDKVNYKFVTHLLAHLYPSKPFRAINA